MAVTKVKSANDNPVTGNVVFIKNCLPPLESGTYTVTVEQAISFPSQDSSPTGKINETYTNTRRFAVTGPRFRLDPEFISSVYPPHNANGEYSNVLPHVCFTRGTLPWERSLGSSDLSDAAVNVAPWLAVLVIGEDDPACEIKQVTVLDLLNKNHKTTEGSFGNLDNDYLSPVFPEKTDAELGVGEKWEDPCMVIDIPVALFNQIAPSKDDLKWLGHVREVKAGPQSASYLTTLQAMSDEITPPRFSVAIANRFPAKGRKSTAVVVSFENFAKYLPGNDGTSSPAIPAGTNYVRAVLLKQWTFYAVAQEETFSGYLTNLNSHDTPLLNGYLQLAPDKGATEADRVINNAFNMGYVPLNHLTRQGDKTVSWYRGPLLPYNEPGSIYDGQQDIDLPVQGPDSSTAYNPDTGMFDVSHAAAYQLGRLLALQNNNFAQTLYNWKRKNLQTVISNFEKEIIRQSLGEIVDGNGGPDNHIDDLLTTGLKNTLTEFVRKTKTEPRHEDQ